MVTSKDKDSLAGLSERIDALVRRNPELSDTDVETLHTVSEIIDTLVLWTDHGKVPEKLLVAVVRSLKRVRLKWSRGMARCRKCSFLIARDDVLDNQGTCRRCGRKRARVHGPHHDFRSGPVRERHGDWLTK